MATSADLIRELQINAAVLTERLAKHADDLGRIDPTLTRQTESVSQLATRVAVLETKVSEFQRYLEESARRRWGVYMALLGSFLTLGVNIVLTFWRQ